jgi:hypothetical protein
MKSERAMKEEEEMSWGGGKREGWMRAGRTQCMPQQAWRQHVQKAAGHLSSIGHELLN